MKHYRVALLRREFPFLDGLFVDCEGRVILSPEHVDYIKVAKGDQSLLGNKGYEDSYSWCDGGHYDYTVYFAVWSDDEGEHVLELEGAGSSADEFGRHKEWDADTVGEQLFSRDIHPDFIIECTKNDTDDNGNGKVTHLWTIYKMRNFDLANYHQQHIDEAANALKLEIDACCS